MQTDFAVRVELDVSAQKIIQQLQLNNEGIEKQFESALTNVFEELTKDETFTQVIEQGFKREIMAITNACLMSYNLKKKIQEAVEKTIDTKLTEFTNKIGKQVESAITGIKLDVL